MANQHSVIEHRANYFFLKIEEDYIAIFPPEDKHRHCKAAILSILEHWMNSKRTENEQHPDMYVYLSYPQFAKQMFDLFGRSTVIRCMKELVIEELVLSHPYVDSFNQKTFAYMLNIDMINAKLRALPERKGSVKVNGGSVKINDPHLKVNDPSSKNELPSFKSKRNIDYIDTNIDSPQIDKEEGEIATSNEDRNAPTNVYHLEEKRQRRGDTDPRMKAMPKGDTNDRDDLSSDRSDQPGDDSDKRGSSLSAPGYIGQNQPVGGTERTVLVQQAGTDELNTPSSLGTGTAPAQRSALSPSAAVQGAHQDKRKVKRVTQASSASAQGASKSKGKRVTQAIELEAVRIMDDWDSLFKRPSPRTDNHIKAAESLIASNPTKEDLDNVRKFCFSSNPDWYRNKGVTLIDVSRNFGKWQSLQEVEQYTYPLKAVANGDVAPQEDDDYSGFDIYKGNGKEERAAMRALYEVMEANGELI